MGVDWRLFEAGPADAEHSVLFRVGGVPSRKLNLYTPAAMVGYFDDLSAELISGVDDPDRVSAIAGRYSMEVVGPVPESYM